MNGTARVFAIEFRRNAGLWFLPVIIAVAWWLLDTQIWTPFLWRDTNRLLPESFLPFAGPAIAGVSAWMAGRDRRRGVEDLLETTPQPSARRHMTVWAATAAWGLLAYLLFAIYMLGQTTTQATWSGPALWPVVIAVAAVLAHAAWGFFLGGFISSRFTAPLVAVGALGVQQLAAQHMQAIGTNSSQSTWINQLAAHNGTSDQHALFYLGLAGTGLALIALRTTRRILGFAGLVLAAGLAVAGGVMIWGEYPRTDWEVVTTAESTTLVPQSVVVRNNFGQVLETSSETSPVPVCKGEPVTVCTHPAYEPVLDRAVFDATALAEPLLGLPGVPTRVEGNRDAPFSAGRNGRAYLDVSRYAERLVAEAETLEGGYLRNEAQIAIRDWLLMRTGWFQHFGCDNLMLHPPPHDIGFSTQTTCAASERFMDLSGSEQRSWLEGHYTQLRAGELSLEDLP